MIERSHILPEHDVRPYSIPQLADRWGCSDSMIRKLIKQGELTCFRIGVLMRISAAEVQRFEAIVAAPPVAVEPVQIEPAPKRVISCAPRRRKPIIIDRSKVCPPPSKRPPKTSS